MIDTEPDIPGAPPPSTVPDRPDDSFRPVGGFHFLAGVVLPVVCFALGFPDRPHWQSGTLQAYSQLLLSREASLPLYPFLLHSMVCMTLLLGSPEKFRKYFLVRFGIFTGVLIAAEYWILFLGSMGALLHAEGAAGVIFASILVGGLPWGAGWLLTPVASPQNSRRIRIAVLLLAYLLAATPLLPIYLLCSTPWALASYLSVSIRLARESRESLRISLAQFLGFVTWFAAHCGEWRLSFTLMLEQYAQLPLTPPEECFVCTATAKGHERVVGGEPYVAPGGVTYRVNNQLRALKAFELLLLSLWPLGHRMCRRCYNCLGPKVAAWLVRPLLADCGYLALKPAEWIALACLSLALPGRRELVDNLYRSAEDRTPFPGALR